MQYGADCLFPQPLLLGTAGGACPHTGGASAGVQPVVYRGDQRSGVSDPDRGCGGDPLLEVGHRCGKGHPSDASHHGFPAAAGRVHAAQ